MNKKSSKFIAKQVDGVKDLIKDFVPRLSSLLAPQIWQNQETLNAGVASVFTGFLASRIKGMIEDISTHGNDFDQNVIDSDKSKHLLIDLVNFAGQENPDTEVWDAAKKIFIRTLKKNTKDQERASLYELLSICKELKGTEIKILAAAYDISRLGTGLDPVENHRNINIWATGISKVVGLHTSEEVLRYEDNLINQKLIAPRELLNGNVCETWIGAQNTLGHRLTPLGLKFAEALIKE